jgi:hypothetical protein
MSDDESADFNEDVALKVIVQGTAAGTGEAFFSALVENPAQAIGVHGAWVTELEAEACRLKSLAFWLGPCCGGYSFAIGGGEEEHSKTTMARQRAGAAECLGTSSHCLTTGFDSDHGVDGGIKLGCLSGFWGRRISS